MSSALIKESWNILFQVCFGIITRSLHLFSVNFKKWMLLTLYQHWQQKAKIDWDSVLLVKIWWTKNHLKFPQSIPCWVYRPNKVATVSNFVNITKFEVLKVLNASLSSETFRPLLEMSHRKFLEVWSAIVPRQF